MTRCAIYARFSTDRQDVQSIETQLMMCRREIVREGWQEVACFTDAAKSAATIHRPGMKALLAAMAAGDIDIVYADAMDRLSRGQADIATLFERLRFRGIILATRKEGRMTPLHIGLQQIVPAETAVVVRIFEDYATGLSPITITRRLNAEGVSSPRYASRRHRGARVAHRARGAMGAL